jgi:hypothetical protein
MHRRPSKEELKKINFKMGVFVSLLGWLILALMGFNSYNHYELVKYGRYASGTVLGCVNEAHHVPSRIASSSRNLLQPITYVDKCYKYQIEFQPVSGKKIDIFGGPNTKSEEANGAVTILYMADDPQHTAMIDDPPSIFFWGFGLILCLIGYPLLRLRSKD